MLQKLPLLNFFKKKPKVNFVYNLLKQPSIYNNKSNTINISQANTSNKKEILTWFWNKSINKIDSNKEKKDIRNVNRKDLKKQFKIKQIISYKAL